MGSGIRPVKYLVKQVTVLWGGGGIRPVKYLVKQVTVLWGGGGIRPAKYLVKQVTDLRAQYFANQMLGQHRHNYRGWH